MTELQIRLHPEIGDWREDKKHDIGLGTDIKKRGLLQKMTARRLEDGTLEVIAGTRRYRELSFAGIEIDPEKHLDIRENVTDRQALLIAYAENRHRKDLTPFEEAKAFTAMLKQGMSVKAIATNPAVKRSENYVRSRLVLLDLPKEIREMIEKGQFDFSYADPLKKLNDFPEARLRLAKQIIEGQKGRYSGVSSIEEANRKVEAVFAEKKKEEQLLIDYGPCPKCGGKRLKQDEYYQKDKLTCLACSHQFHKDTKDPWEYWRLKEQAQDLGLTLELEAPRKAKLSPKEVAEILDEAKKAEKISPSFRSKKTMDEILGRLIGDDNILEISVFGEHVNLKLIEETPLYFKAFRKTYNDGNKTKVVIESGWREDDTIEARMPLVKDFFQSLTKTLEGSGAPIFYLGWIECVGNMNGRRLSTERAQFFSTHSSASVV